MPKPLITKEQYEYFLETGRPYEGYVWTKEGTIYYAENHPILVALPQPTPPNRAIGTSDSTRFMHFIAKPVISILNIGSSDYLFDTGGNFVTVINATDSLAGEIMIIKDNTGNLFDNATISTWRDLEMYNIKSIIVPIKDITLSSLAYIKIYTHMISLVGRSVTIFGSQTITIYEPPMHDITITFDRSESLIKIYSDGVYLTSFEAHNIATSKSNGKWPNGTYTMLDQNAALCHTGDRRIEDTYDNAYGDYGIYRANEFYDSSKKMYRNGMGLHSGRENNPSHPTNGCIRTTDEAMAYLQTLIGRGNRFASITVQD
ncbi:MAG: L,D-transpeptidase [Tannerella sp.]|jgi:hypothetical protein|nr:L,D-transpeptidase [Tannerella sp.]